MLRRTLCHEHEYFCCSESPWSAMESESFSHFQFVLFYLYYSIMEGVNRYDASSYQVSHIILYPEIQLILVNYFCRCCKIFLLNFFVKKTTVCSFQTVKKLNAFDIFFSGRQCLNKDDQPVFKICEMSRHCSWIKQDLSRKLVCSMILNW